MRRILIGGIVAAAVFVAPAPADAEARCFGTGVGTAGFTVCVGAEAGLDGTTVAPGAHAYCYFTGVFVLQSPCEHNVVPPGNGFDVSVGRTGFVPNPSFPPPCVDAERGTIRSEGGTIGTLYVGGTIAKIHVPPFYAGDPAGC